MQGLLEKLSGLSSMVTQKRVVAKAVRAGCEPIRARAEQLAPIDTGTLRESMMFTVTEQSATEAIGKIGPSRKGFYAHIPEFGLAHNPAQPFLRPAFDEKIEEAKSLISAVIVEAVEAEVK